MPCASACRALPRASLDTAVGASGPGHRRLLQPAELHPSPASGVRAAPGLAREGPPSARGLGLRLVTPCSPSGRVPPAGRPRRPTVVSRAFRAARAPGLHAVHRRLQVRPPVGVLGALHRRCFQRHAVHQGGKQSWPSIAGVTSHVRLWGFTSLCPFLGLFSITPCRATEKGRGPHAAGPQRAAGLPFC